MAVGRPVEVGERFGKLVVLHREGRDSRNSSTWRCKCDCGAECLMVGHRLRSGRKKSCGCDIAHIRPKQPVVEGERFGKLVVLSREGRDTKSCSVWRCKCDCGNECLSQGPRLREGSKNSCGCIQSSEESIQRRVKVRRENQARAVTPIVGTRFGRLVVVGDDRGPMVSCRCDCGVETPSKRHVLLAGHKKSCGCLKRDNLSEIAKSQARAARIKAGMPVDEPIYERQPIPELARRIKARDNYTCALCGSRGVRLVTHHIVSWFLNRLLHEDPTNLVTLCDCCHKTRAHRGGFKCPPDEEVAEVLREYVRGLPFGGRLEKHGNLELTPDEERLILSGVVPERIKQNWEDLSLADLLHFVNKQPNERVYTNGCN